MDERKRAKPATPERYLWDKPGARHLWFRMAVPVRFRAVEQRRIVQRCLGTRDRREASLKAARLRADLNAHWQEKLAGVSSEPAVPAGSEVIPTEADLKRAATEAAYVQIQPKLQGAWENRRAASPTAHEDFIRDLKSARDRYIATKETTTLAMWERLADKRIAENAWVLPKGVPEYDAFVQMVAEAAIEVLRVELERRSGNFGAEPTSKVVTAGLSAVQNTAAAGETIAELFERYAAQRLAEKRKRADTVEQDRKIVLQFATFIGSGKSVRRITQAEVREWRDTIAALPPKFASAKGYEGLSLRAAAAKARASSAPKMSPTTVNKYLSTVSPFLGWCVRNGFAERNPCDGLFYDLPKGRNPRPPFSSEQLQQIFCSPLFTGFESDGKEHRPGQQRANDWRFWIPLTCLFTGARITEIAQLRTDDLHYDGDVPFITICHDESRQQTTKSGHTRVMPLHPKLVQLGFVAFVEQQSQRSAVDGNPRLFPELNPSQRGSLGAAPSRFWRNYLCRAGIKSNADGFGSHSFRHALTDRLRLAGYLDEEIKVVLGHSQKSVTSGYGRIRQGTVERILKMIEKIEFKEANVLLNP